MTENNCSVSPTRSLDASDEEEERKHFQRIVTAFRCYKLHSLRRWQKTLLYLNSLPEKHQEVLKNHRSHLDKVRVAIEHNYEILKLIIQDVAHMFENADHSEDVKTSLHSQALVSDMDKLQSVLKQFVREWSKEGEEERRACFKPILDAIQKRFPPEFCNTSEVSVLVPGAGLGRLAFEIAKKGYMCQGNEFSLFMLFASNFILNKCKGVNLYRMYPWVHQYFNNYKSEDQVQSVLFPDLDPSDLPKKSEFSMAAGNFVEVYTEPDSWDCVATCFFLDTSNNIVNYIDCIWKILKPGGYWINIGPLLYHYADLPHEDSIEPSYEEVRNIIFDFGFVMEEEEANLKTPYTQNPRSMMFFEYRSVYFVCRKPHL